MTPDGYGLRQPMHRGSGSSRVVEIELEQSRFIVGAKFDDRGIGWTLLIIAGLDVSRSRLKRA